MAKKTYNIRVNSTFKSRLIFRLIIGGFLSLLVASIGGALYPRLIHIIQPVVCAEGQISTAKHHYRHRMESGYTVSVHCVKPSGSKKNVGFFSGFLTLWLMLTPPCMLFIWLLGLYWRARLRRKYGPNYREVLRRKAEEQKAKLRARRPQQSSGSLSTKLSALDEAKAQGLISESEYQEKRREILEKF